MKRLQIMLEEDLDQSLSRLCGAEGISKAALIRRLVRAALTPLPPLAEDPISDMVGTDDYEPGDIDDLLYG